MKVKLKDIAEFSKGNQINGSDLIDGAEYIYLNGGINPSGKWNDYNVEAGTITISEGGNSCGYVNFINEPFWCGAHCYYLYNIDGNEKYLYYALKSQESRLMRLRSGACMPNIKKSDLGEFYFTYENDLKKQEDIVKKFDNVENCIFLLQEELKKIELLIKSRFIEMFGDPLANPFKWNVKLIEDVVASSKNSLKSGPFGSALKKEYYVKSGYKVYGQEQVISGNFKVGNYYIDEKRYKILENYAIQEGDVLISLVGTYGKLLIMSDNFEPGIINPRLLKITFDKSKVNSIYFKYYFESESLKKALSENTHGGTMAILNLSIVRKLAMPLPPLELQNQFADFVQQVNKSELAVKASLEKLETLKKSLMQQYFG